jgi:hypothetical protein
MAPTPAPRMEDVLHLQVLALAVQLESQAVTKGRHASFTTFISEAAALLKAHRADIAAALLK